MSALSFTNLRVNIDESVHSIYTELTTKAESRAEDVPFIKMPDLFIASCCIGVKENLYKELGKKKDIFVADAFDKRIQIPMLIALASKRLDNVDELADPRKILSICECWANGGINLINEQVLAGKGLRPLYRLIDFILRSDYS